MYFRINKKEEEVAINGEVYDYFVAFKRDFYLGSDFRAYIDIFNSVYINIVEMNIEEGLKEAFKTLNDILNNVGELYDSCKGIRTRREGNFKSSINYKEECEEMIEIYRDFKIDKPYLGVIDNPINKFNIKFTDKEYIDKVKYYIKSRNYNQTGAEVYVSDSEVYGCKNIDDKSDDMSVELAITDSVYKKCERKLATLVSKSNKGEAYDNFRAILSIVNDIPNLSINNAMISEYSYFSVTSLGMHEETSQSVNSIINAYKRLLNSNSMRTGKYQHYDRLEIENLIEYARAVEDRIIKVMEHQFNSNNW